MSLRLFLFLTSMFSLGHAAMAETPVRDDIVIADFEQADFDGWSISGEAFGKSPVSGAISGQMDVSGFTGDRLANSYHGGDNATGSLTSTEFVIDRPYINLLVGGGGYPDQTCIQLKLDGDVVKTACGENTEPGGSERLFAVTWTVEDLIGRTAVIEIVDTRQGGWGHITVDDIRQSDTAAAEESTRLENDLLVDNTHLIVPVSNLKDRSTSAVLGIYHDGEMIQNFTVNLPHENEPSWLAAYPLSHFNVKRKTITIRPIGRTGSEPLIRTAFDAIHVGSDEQTLSSNDFDQPYRNQFHISTRRGWNNDPNGMVYHDGKYHLYYQYNPFGIFWGNMHWGHFESKDLVHWTEQPIALYQNSIRDMAFSGGGFVDQNNTAGFGDNVLFVAFTSTGRGECLAYSKDEGMTFTEIEENPVVKHRGRDPKVIWYEPQKKWVMAVYDEDSEAITDSILSSEKNSKFDSSAIAFFESKNLHNWKRTGAFSHADRRAVYECPELFSLPIENSDKSKWILYAGSNRYFIGDFDGSEFVMESGPHGDSHGAMYAAQTFSGDPQGRRVQIGWARTAAYVDRFPAQVSNQAFTLPHTLTLRQTDGGPRIFYQPVEETRNLELEVLVDESNLTAKRASELLQACNHTLTRVEIEFDNPTSVRGTIDGIAIDFEGSTATIFTDRTLNEVYAEGGLSYHVHQREPKSFDNHKTELEVNDLVKLKSLKVTRLKSIFSSHSD